MRRMSGSRGRLVLTLALLFILSGVPSAFAQSATPVASPVASPVSTMTQGDPKLDVLFIGAHPDDEAWALSAYGQWNEYSNMRIGVITITRGEGGGNAVGTEEGPALGLLREDEERRAVGVAGIERIYNLDHVDFYYTVSAELTENTWGYEDTLSQVVRVVRETQPAVIVTMNPAPTPGNHGHHQVAARLAYDAYLRAGNADEFATQISDEGLEAWTPLRIFTSSAAGERAMGPTCAEGFVPVEPTDVVFGVYSGTVSDRNNGASWASVARSGQQTYASQGWAAIPDESDNPDELGCVYFTLLDSRGPFDATATHVTAALDGAAIEADGGLPLGSQFYITSDTFVVTPGVAFTADVHLDTTAGGEANVELTVPDGWTSELASSADGVYSFTVTPAANAPLGQRANLGATVTIGSASGQTTEPVLVQANVNATLQPLTEVESFRSWVESVDAPQLDSLLFPVFAIGVGETREVTVTVTNSGDAAADASVALTLPAGFTAEPATESVSALAPGASEDVTFSVTNADATLPTANEANDGEGFYPFTIDTTSGDVTATTNAGINLVPVASFPAATTAPTIDGVVSDGEYPGEPIDVSRVWEGDPVESSADGSGSAVVTHDENGIYVAVTVQDDTLGTVLPTDDAKRHWRTDSVEIAIDPLGTAGNTSQTFKIGAFPTTTEGEPAAYRDADAYQGPVSETAPGFEIASTVNDPYDGYVIEVFIPYSALPADIDPEHAAMNVFIYDSDTQDLTGQTRLGWSTYNGVQGDPYRWGHTVFEGYAGPTDRTTLEEPVMPLEAAQSIASPLSLAQYGQDGVTPGGHAAVPDGEGLELIEYSVEGTTAKVQFRSLSDGTVYVVAADGYNVSAVKTTEMLADSGATIQIDVVEGQPVYLNFVDAEGRVQIIKLTQ